MGVQTEPGRLNGRGTVRKKGEEQPEGTPSANARTWTRSPSEQEVILILSHPNSRPSQNPPAEPRPSRLLSGHNKEKLNGETRQPTHISLCCLS